MVGCDVDMIQGDEVIVGIGVKEAKSRAAEMNCLASKVTQHTELLRDDEAQAKEL